MTGLDRPQPSGSGPLDSARALGASVLALLSARAELVSIELKEAAERRKRLVTLALVALLFSGCALLLSAFFVVVIFWDSHRVAAVAAVTLVYGVIGVRAAVRFRALLRDSPPPFNATLDEFRHDLEVFRGRDE